MKSPTATVGSIFLGLVAIAVFKSILYFRKKQEDQVRVDKFLEDYRAEKPARFTYADLKRMTNGFKEKLGEGAHGAVFRGKLSTEILVAVKILNNTEREGNEFINEVGIMGKIHHINVVRLLGFCAEGLHRALVYNFFPNGSLQSFIVPPEDKDHFLGWEKLQHVALGIAKGIEYLHQGCNHPIIHFCYSYHLLGTTGNFTTYTYLHIGKILSTLGLSPHGFALGHLPKGLLPMKTTHVYINPCPTFCLSDVGLCLHPNMIWIPAIDFSCIHTVG